MAPTTWKVGVVGYGFSAKIFHIPFITAVSNFKLHAIVQRTPKPDDDAQKDHPGVKGYRSAEDMVKDADIDVVVITTAPDSHYYLTKLALEAGKHGMVTSSTSGGVYWLIRRHSCCREALRPNPQRV
jgi:predicted dehydrogenase